MEYLSDQLNDDVIELILKHINISSEVKVFIRNKHIPMKNIDKNADLVNKNLCIENDKNILTDLYETMKKVEFSKKFNVVR